MTGKQPAVSPAIFPAVFPPIQSMSENCGTDFSGTF